MNNSKGFTLIELIIVCLILVLVILITNSAFEHIISKSGQLSKASKSNIDGIVGLELMRADLESTGFGLPWSFANPIKYDECKVVDNYTVSGINRIDGIKPSSSYFNDGRGPSANGDVPRAILSGTATSGCDYLVIKSAAVGDERASRRWSYVGYSSSGEGILRSYQGSENLEDKDNIITLSMGFGADAANSGTARRLIPPIAVSDYYHTINSAKSDPPPGDASEYYVAYGISSKNKPAMPFNRVDYYIYRDANSISQSCATGPGVGNLYRSSIKHSDGLYNEMPLLNCVLDMQVYYMLDRNNDGDLKPAKTLTNPDSSNMTAQQIREQVKSIQVNILAQEGGIDRNYTYSGNTISFGLYNQSGSLLKTWDNTMLQRAAGDNWRNYRWKVYTITAQPKNLNK